MGPEREQAATYGTRSVSSLISATACPRGRRCGVQLQRKTKIMTAKFQYRDHKVEIHTQRTTAGYHRWIFIDGIMRDCGYMYADVIGYAKQLINAENKP
jgi:hypothetical protein